jgi:hypothetical protein
MRGIEGALAGSLYFQFKDRAIRIDEEIRRLRDFGSKDLRYKPIADNVALMVASRPPAVIHWHKWC